MFVDRPAASTEGDDRDDQAEADQEDGNGEDGVIIEVQILPPCYLNDNTGNDDNTSEHLQIKVPSIYAAFADKT